MADRKNNNLGEEIQDIVQNAVNTMDFEKLNSEITTTVNTALSEVRQALGIQVSNRQIEEKPTPGTWRPVGPQKRIGLSKDSSSQDNKDQIQGSIAGRGRIFEGNIAGRPRPPVNSQSKEAFNGANQGNNRLVKQDGNISMQNRMMTAQSENQRPPVSIQKQPNNGSWNAGNQRNNTGGPEKQGMPNRGQNQQPMNERPFRQSSIDERVPRQNSGNERPPRQNSANEGQGGQAGQRGFKNLRQAVGNAVNTQKNRMEERRDEFRQTVNNQRTRNVPARGETKRGVPIPYIPTGSVSGTLCSIFGILGGSCTGIAMLVMFILALVTGEATFVAIFTGLLPIFVISLFIASSGSKKRARIRRMKSYLKVLQVKGFSTIKELANSTGSTEKFVKKDLRKMLSLGMFPEGQLDDKKTCFMATRGSCEQYRIAQNGYEQREEEERARLAEQKRREAKLAKEAKENGEQESTQEDIKNQAESTSSSETLPKEVRETIESGRNYMKQIKAGNEAIPEEDISEKLDRLELVVDRILYHIEKHPEQLSEIRKFMNYYLPTTLKLVNAYQEFNSQPVQGDNIKTAKQEIQNTLDTINIAFENLFDSLFEDAAMDVSTDISVLQTMLAQEGLTGNDFE